MRWLAQFSIFGLFCASCAIAPALPPAPALPFGEFVGQVLDPLAGTLADERIEQAQVELKSGELSVSLLSLLGIDFGPEGSVVGGGLATLNDASIEQQSAYLDTRRHPLKKEILSLLTQRTKIQGDQYHVCVNGAERRYGVQEGKFIRLTDGPGPCEAVLLSTKEGTQ